MGSCTSKSANSIEEINKSTTSVPENNSTKISDIQIKENHNHIKYDFKPINNLHLIVDDAKYNREIFKQYLNKFNINSEEAKNGQEALDMVENNKTKYDIIWMDLRMPIMDGIESSKILRKNDFNGIII
jgi:PleD family two-component response regulator